MASNRFYAAEGTGCVAYTHYLDLSTHRRSLVALADTLGNA